ncbi:MAG TPA: hypothetical protein VGH32_00075 [Pirellulales bacterium]|jgi:hypothetical protein
MSVTGRQLRGFLSVAATAALYSLPHPATAANGGTIYFRGAIVAPQFDISSAAAAAPLVASTNVQRVSSPTTVLITFNAPHAVASGVDVTLQVKDGDDWRSGEAAFDTIAARFVGSANHRLAPSTDGHFRVDRDGGTLSLSPRTGSLESTKRPVMVVISYD